MKLQKLFISLGVGITLFSLAACGGKKDGADKKETLTVWTHPYGSSKDDQNEVFEKMASNFKKNHPNVNIKYQIIPWANKEQKITTALSSGQGPDIYYLLPDMMPQFAQKGLVEPLNDHLDKSFSEDDFGKSAINAVTYDGKIYGLPMLQDVYTYVYNKELVQKIGGDINNLPKTWDEFNDLAEKAKEQGLYARNFEGGVAPNFTLYPFIWQSGGDIIKDGKATIDSPDAIKAWEQINMMYKNGYIAKDSISTMDQLPNFIEGKSFAVQINGSQIRKVQSSSDIDLVIGSPLKETKQATYGTLGMFSVSKTSKQKDLATEFVQTMTNEENMLNFCKMTGYLPPRTAVLEELSNDNIVKSLGQYLDVTIPGVIDPSSRTIIPLVQANIQSMFEGNTTPEEAAKEAAKQINEELEKSTK